MSRPTIRIRGVVSPVRSREDERGQVIVLFAFVLVGLLLVGALVLDVARVYTVTQYERSVADAAALAGAQDLQKLPTASVSSADYPKARCDAYALLVRELGGSATPPTCPPPPALLDPMFSSDLANVSITSATGTRYVVSITTPYPGAVTVSPSKAVKVAISQPGFALSFGNVVCLLPGSGCSSGAPVWNPTVASVAGGARAAQYALMTLQPGGNLCTGTGGGGTGVDLTVQGGGSGDTTGTTLNILSGDVGSNTTACTGNMGGTKPGALIVTSDYYVDHLLALPGDLPTWWPSTSVGRRIYTPINDPNYTPPASYLATYPTQPDGAYSSSPSCSNTDTDPNYIPTSLLDATPGVTWTCYKPGWYSNQFKLTGGDNAYLEPGAYYFARGLSVGSGNFLAGGLISPTSGSAPGAGSPYEGVVLVFPENQPSWNFSTAGGATVLLNVGDVTLDTTTTPARVVPANNGHALPAYDAAGNEITTPQGWVLTVMVLRDPNCFDGLVPKLCSTTQNQVVQLTGGADLQIAGVIYGPSDNMQIVSNGTSQVGGDGQIVSYTISYGGGALLTQSYPGPAPNDVLRLDSACSAGEPCP